MVTRKDIRSHFGGMDGCNKCGDTSDHVLFVLRERKSPERPVDGESIRGPNSHVSFTA